MDIHWPTLVSDKQMVLRGDPLSHVVTLKPKIKQKRQKAARNRMLPEQSVCANILQQNYR